MTQPSPMIDFDRSDAAVCECCELPTCESKQPGIGYVCLPCCTHYDDGTDPSGRTSGHDIGWEHEKLASAVRAVLAYKGRH
jgi:hypothetical protein